MQLTFRIDDSNYVTTDLRIQATGDDGYADGPEVIAAVVSDSKLSNIEQDQLLDLAADVLDFLAAKHPVKTGPRPDWYENEFLPATRQKG